MHINLHDNIKFSVQRNFSQSQVVNHKFWCYSNVMRSKHPAMTGINVVKYLKAQYNELISFIFASLGCIRKNKKSC